MDLESAVAEVAHFMDVVTTHETWWGLLNELCASNNSLGFPNADPGDDHDVEVCEAAIKKLLKSLTDEQREALLYDTILS